MTRAEFEADLQREGYAVREGELGPNVHRTLHTHEFDARIFILSGGLTMDYGHERVSYAPGQACAVPAGTLHAEHTEADGARYVFGQRAALSKATAR